ncbi:aldose epimerase [Opitutaceae bacterium EW11]|nr:aldose epimerase [Opitutaceae bacterium EW11]
MEKVPYLGQHLTRWEVGTSTFLALPEKGARLMHWHVTLGDGTVREVIHWPDLQSLDAVEKVRGGNPILFPFSGRSFDQGEIGFWRGPDGIRRPMPMHGIARQGEFKVTRMDERGFAAQLIPNEAAREAYPFDYEFTVTYRFAPLGLICEFTLRNLDKQPIPWSAGHHFYFTVPWADGQKRSDYAIRIPAGRSQKQNQANGEVIPVATVAAQEPLSNPALVDTQHLALKNNTVVFGPAKSPGEVAVKIGTSRIPPPDATIVTWTAAEDSPFYCVEPWMGPPNAPGTKTGLAWVPPGQTQSFIVELAVK